MSWIEPETREQATRLGWVAGRWALHAFLPALLGIVLVTIHHANWVATIYGDGSYVDPSIFFNCFGFNPAQIAQNAAASTEAVFGVAVLTLCLVIAFKRRRHAQLRPFDRAEDQ